MQAGVVWSWEDLRELGLVSFTSFNGNQGGMCPIVEVVDSQLGNGAPMQLAFAGQTPPMTTPWRRRSPPACELTLDQALAPGGEFECTLELDGMPLVLDDVDGWSMTAPARVTLGGSACAALSQGATASMLCSYDAF